MKKIFLFFSLLAIAYGLCFAQVALVRHSSKSEVGWQADGVPVCTAVADQQYPVIVPDQKGGGILIWQDYRAGNWDLYAQRVDSSGNRLWAGNGVAIATGTQDQRAPKAISDMRGGAIVVYNRMDGIIWYDIWAQRVDSAGNPCWGANGVDVSSLINSIQGNWQIISDSLKGAIISWTNNDTLSVNAYDVYAQRIDSSGSFLWTATGVVVVGTTEDEGSAMIVEDTKGGAVVVWSVNNWPEIKFYGQRISNTGALMWPSPAPVCTTSNVERYIQGMTTDGRGGV